MQTSIPRGGQSLARYLVKLLLLIFLFELLIIVGIIFGGRLWLTKLKSDEVRVNVTQVPPKLQEELIVQKMNGNGEAFEFIIYELIQTRQLDFAGFIREADLAAYLDGKLGAKKCPNLMTTRHCETSDGFVIGFAPLDFENERLGYVVQETRINLSRSAVDPASAGYIGVALGMGFLINMFGVMALFRRRVTREISQLKAALTLFRTGEATESEGQKAVAYSIAEFQDMAVTIDEATALRKTAILNMQKATKAESMLQTAQMLAHDIRRPFSLVHAGLQTLRGARDLAEAERKIANLDSEVKRWVGSVNGMLEDLIELGSSPVFQTEAIELNAVVAWSLKEVAMIRGYPDVPIRWDCSQTYFVIGNANKLHRVILNIVANALEATDCRTTLSVQCSAEDGSIRLAITNTGSSIPTDQLGKVFDVFYTKGKANGSGLGLAIAKQIVERHGGQIWCESAVGARGEQNTNVTFVIRLPLLRVESNAVESFPENMRGLRDVGQRVPAEVAGGAGLADGRQGRLLAVAIDDDVFYRDFLVHLFSREPKLADAFDVQVFDTPQGATEKIAQAPALILCDLSLTMEDQAGLGVVALLKKRYPGSILVAHSDAIVSNVDLRQAGLEQGPLLRVLPKPLDEQMILKLMSDLFGRTAT